MAVLSLLFAVAAFTSALLLFWIQPMIARTLLPVLGGVPSVWNTCMVFFQAMLLAGYGYAHLISSRLSLSRQIGVHVVLLAAAACFLPFGSSSDLAPGNAPDSNPTFWLLGTLFATVGLPFFFVSSNGPLLQNWFARTRLGATRDPYTLYSASNLGSLVGLLSYPVLVEPNLRLALQSWLWTVGYGCLGVLLFSCMTVVWHSAPRDINEPSSIVRFPANDGAGQNQGSVRAQWRVGFRWMVLAFVPSSLMLGVTTYLTTDIASIPLLWIIPLAIYLLSFILVFARRTIVPWRSVARPLPIAAVALVFLILSRATQPMVLLICAHLLFFFLACMVCHGQLAEERPPVAQLTRFYLWLSFGSVLGSACTALVAPHIFTTIAEYPLAIVLACLLRPWPGRSLEKNRWRWLDVALPLLLGTLTISLAMMAPVFDWSSALLRNALVIGVPMVLAFTFVDRPIRFGLGLAAVILVCGTQPGSFGKTLHVERNFFGVSRVTSSEGGKFHHFVHGNTLHGRQRTDSNGECEPLTYYHRTGPIGEVFKWLEAVPGPAKVAMIGLGAGSTGCYAQAGQEWTFYEIDPAVIRIAQDTNYFTYLSTCARAEFRIIPGDARLRLREAPDGYFRLIVLDAFSSDAIPAHLLTREAIRLYLSKLAPDGAIAFHISNRYLDLEPVMGALARDANLFCRSFDDWNLGGDEEAKGKEQSQWVILSRKKDNLAQLIRNTHWLPIEDDGGASVWTDDFSNILSVFKWK